MTTAAKRKNLLSPTGEVHAALSITEMGGLSWTRCGCYPTNLGVRSGYLEQLRAMRRRLGRGPLRVWRWTDKAVTCKSCLRSMR